MKKRIIYPALFLIISASVIFLAARYTGSHIKGTDTVQPQQTIHTAAEQDSLQPESEFVPKPETYTLMIYMNGSDLESRSGAATSDLEEMLLSGVYLENNNIIVYTGGSKMWHNENVNAEENTVLEMTAGGFEVVHKAELSSMGESGTLLNFLDYTVENYPADNYSLIMWNHGNGPVMGYGKDMLFDGDSLTLSEMKAAFEASPFNSDNKLEFIGFDACLMASAELACILDDHARYLVSSQEVEPSFGWNYAFLSGLGNIDTETLLSNLIDGYMDTCLAYYESKGYKNRDTTLSCMDLSYAAELENTVNDLFLKASESIDTQYNFFTVKRVDTRALGRLSTGSEYDLVDLYDLAENLAVPYPEQIETVQSVIDKMIIYNGSNSDSLSGISIYYPFYNKYLYGNGWAELYDSIDVLEGYRAYVEKYGNILMTPGGLDEVTESVVPVKDKNKYRLELTPRQQETFAEAKYHVLLRRSHDIYQPVFSSSDVKYKDGVITANFSGNGIYVKNDHEEYFLPSMTEIAFRDGISYYMIPAVGYKKGINEKDILGMVFTADLQNFEGGINGVYKTPFDPNKEDVGTGKLEEADQSDYKTLSFYYFSPKRLTRNENGIMPGIDKWDEINNTMWVDYDAANNIRFVFAPLDDGEYYLVFEITDTHGEKYCSELVEIEHESDGKSEYTPDEIKVQWTDGNEVLVFQKEDISIYLTKSEDNAENQKLVYKNTGTNNEYRIDISRPVLNGDIYCGTSASEEWIVPGETYTVDEFLAYDMASSARLVNTEIVSSFSFVLDIIDKDGRYVAFNQTVNVYMSPETALYLGDYSTLHEKTTAFNGAKAEPQVLLETEDFRLTLLSFGENNELFGERNCGSYCFESLSDKYLSAEIDAYVNGVYYGRFAKGYAIPKTKEYGFFGKPYGMDGECFSSIETLELNILVSSDSNTNVDDRYYTVPVKLSEKGIAPKLPEEGDVIFDEYGVKLVLEDYLGDTSESGYWRVRIINQSDCGISVKLTDPQTGETLQYLPGYFFPDQQRVENIWFYFDDVRESYTFNVDIYNYDRSELLYESDKAVTLKRVKTDESGINIDWDTPQNINLFSKNGLTIDLCRYDPKKVIGFAMYCEYTGEDDIEIQVSDYVVNGNITLQMEDWISVGELSRTIYFTPDRLVELVKLGELSGITSVSFKLVISDHNDKILERLNVNIDLSGDADFGDLTHYFPVVEGLAPCYDAVAPKQTLYEDGSVRITLLGFGTMAYRDNIPHAPSECGVICIENLTDSELEIMETGALINGYTYEKGSYDPFNLLKLPAGMRYYGTIIGYFYGNEDIVSTESISLAFSFGETIGKEIRFFPVTLSQKGNAPEIADSGTEIYNRDGIRVLLGEQINGYSEAKWNVTVINDSNFDIRIDADPDSGYISSVGCRSLFVYAHSRTNGEFYVNEYDLKPEVSFYLIARDFFEGRKVLSDQKTPIKLFIDVEAWKAERKEPVFPTSEELAELIMASKE